MFDLKFKVNITDECHICVTGYYVSLIRKAAIMGLFGNILRKKKTSKEIEKCESILEKRPDDSNILKRLGDLYLKTDNKKKAAEIYINLGDNYNNKGFYPKAIALYKQAQKILPDWEEPYEKLADLYQMQGFSREAATQYARLAEMIEKAGDNEKAVMYMQKAAELVPSHKRFGKKIRKFNVQEEDMLETPQTPASKSHVHETNFFDLEKELDKEIKELPIDKLNSEQEDDTGVASVFKAITENAIKEGTNDPLFLYNMGLAYRETGLLDEAIDAFKKVIAAGEKLFDTYIMLGTTLREKGLFEESLESLKNGACLKDITSEMKASIFYEIAQTYKAMGDTDHALLILKNIQQEHQDFKDVEMEIGRLNREN
ncbi:MAG: tetratricopeptide repeat protein [Deltaproteobacteria bacterium]|nr:tetratricopeptide repeat protein [Deltaproteobacteria bacterium]